MRFGHLISGYPGAENFQSARALSIKFGLFRIWTQRGSVTPGCRAAFILRGRRLRCELIHGAKRGNAFYDRTATRCVSGKDAGSISSGRSDLVPLSRLAL